MRWSKIAAWAMALVLTAFVTGVPFVYYRYTYTYAKRLRPVVEGKVYRSGCMTAEGFANAIEKLHIRTVINLMDDWPDPDLSAGYFDTRTILESELCAKHGANMVNLALDLIPPIELRECRPAAIDAFVELLDRPEIYPVLIHCRAGLHRTGCMVAIYRMEYQGWTRNEAMNELKANGFGEYAATAANDYIAQYPLRYEPRAHGAGVAGQLRLVPGRLVSFPKE
jgi:protein tyrosine/serine phosphatase